MVDFSPIIMKGVALTILIVVYCALVRRAADVLQPVRLHMAAIGEQLLAENKISNDDRLAVQFCLARAYDAKIAVWTLVLLVVTGPIVVLNAIYQAWTGKYKDERGFSDERMRRFAFYAMLSFWAANPLFGTFCIAFMLGYVAFATLLTGQLRFWQKLFSSLVHVESHSDDRRHA